MAFGRMAMLSAGTALASLALLGGSQPVTGKPPGIEPLMDPAYIAMSACGQVKRKTEFFNPGFLIATVQARKAGVPAPDSDLRDDLGSLSDPITTKAPDAHRFFDQGLRWNYAFNHGEAVRAFRKAQAIDPTCAMCYWGEAFALGPNINYPMQPEAVAPAFAAIAQAMALREGASPRERALIEALAKRYSADPAADRKALDAAYADAMTAVAQAWPDDDQVQVLFADSLMNLQPWDYWAPDKRTPKGRTAEQVATLEKVLQRNPNHPGAIHLYIHTVEASTTPGRAETFADRLNGQMPGAGHLVHMPAHIYYRVGRYLDSLRVNVAAEKADEALFASTPQDPIYALGYYPHNIHFVLVSARMAGDRENTIRAAEALRNIPWGDTSTMAGLVDPILQAPYFAHAQFSTPETVLALPDPGADHPFVQGAWRYARALAEVQAGDLAAAADERQKLADLAEQADFSNLAAWYVPAKESLTAAGKVVDARIARTKGDYATAETALREAAAIQEALPYMEPPYWYYPIRQSLAAVLLEAGKPDEAAKEFQTSLMDTPNNAYALWGLQQALAKAGDAAGSAAAGQRFKASWAGGDTEPKLADL